jgi:hypothetical protein
MCRVREAIVIVDWVLKHSMVFEEYTGMMI